MIRSIHKYYAFFFCSFHSTTFNAVDAKLILFLNSIQMLYKGMFCLVPPTNQPTTNSFVGGFHRLSPNIICCTQFPFGNMGSTSPCVLQKELPNPKQEVQVTSACWVTVWKHSQSPRHKGLSHLSMYPRSKSMQ